MNIVEKTIKERQPLKETQKKMRGITRSGFLNLLNKAAKNGKPYPK
jgi:hypothetical protein